MVDKFELKQTATITCILFAVYFVSLHGKEINKVDLGAMNKYWDKSTTHMNHQHVPLMMSGTFKKETEIKYFCQPLAMQTKKGQDVGVLFCSLLEICKKKGVTKGLMFLGHKEQRMSVVEMDILFHSVLLDVQRKYPSVLSDSVDVKADFSTYQLLQQGSTSEA